MPALLTILTEADLRAYALGLLDDDTRRAIEQAAASDERVRREIFRLRPQGSGHSTAAKIEPKRSGNRVTGTRRV